MKTNKLENCEIRNIDRVNQFQLPNRYKKWGIVIAALAILLLFTNKFILDDETFRFFARRMLLVGFLIISLSKEKIEDELIKNLRMKSYSFAFIWATIYSIAMPFFDYVVKMVLASSKTGLNDSGDFMILWMFLAIQVFYFEYLKRFFK